MNNYYRITGYCESEDFCFIMDCYGMFEKLWQFSSYLLQKGLKVLEVGNDSKFTTGITYKAVKVADKIYIPDRTQTV